MKKRGFTLLELLVVVAILGILLTILIPSIRSTRVKGLSAVSKSNLRELYVAFLDYSQKNNNRFPRYRISQTRNVCFWTREMKEHFGKSKSVMLMPGVTYEPNQWSGYSASEVIMGFNANNQRDKWTGRRVARIENVSETFLIFEGVAAATAFNAEGRVSWNQALRDINRVGSHLTTKLNFFYDEQMNSVKVDGHVSSTHFNSRTDITHSKWTGL